MGRTEDEEGSSNRPTLGELLSEGQDLMEIIIRSEGEILPTLEIAKKENDDALRTKIDAYAYQIRRFEMEAEFRKQEASHQKQIQKTCENIAQRMKDSLKDFMGFYGMKELLGNKDGFLLYESGTPSVELKPGIDPTELPHDFLRVKTITEVNKPAVIEALKSSSSMVHDMLGKYFEFKKPMVLKQKPNTHPKLTTGKKLK